MRSAAVMDEADNRRDAKRLHEVHSLVGPRPVTIVGRNRRGTLPQDRIAEGPDSETGDAADVVRTIGMAAQRELIDVTVTNPVDGALDAAPYLDRAAGRSWCVHLKLPAPPRL